MHHEHGCVWGNCVDLIERWHPTFGKLEFGPTSDHPDPLRRRSSCSLFFQHAQCIGKRGNAIPAQFQVVVEPASDRMYVGIVEAWDDGSPAPVNYARLRAAKAENLFIVANSRYLSGRYGDGFDKRGHPVRGDLGVVQYEVSRHSSLRFGSCNGLRRAEEAPPFGFTCELQPAREPRTREIS